MDSLAIFPLFYLPPISYFHSLMTFNGSVTFEKFENFPKQTYRNRATVLSPNGLLDLIVPVIKGSRLTGNAPGKHTLVKDVKISYDFEWQRLHWRSLESCYRSSAYFEYYEDELRHFYTKKYDFLIDLNIELFEWFLKKLKMKIPITLTIEYSEVEHFLDMRKVFGKDADIQNLQLKQYFQVFDDRNGFQENLSIADLLFNQGPQAINFI